MAFAKISLRVRTQGAGNTIDFNRQANVSGVVNPLEGVTLVAQSGVSAKLMTPQINGTQRVNGVYVHVLSAVSSWVTSNAHVNISFSGQRASAQQLGLGKTALMWPKSTVSIRAMCNSGSSYYVQWGQFTGF